MKNPYADVKNEQLEKVIQSITNLDMVTRIPRMDIEMSLENLRQLDALDNDYNLTRVGKEILKLGISPTYARIIIEGKKHDVLPEILKLVACSENKSAFRAQNFNEYFLKSKNEMAHQFIKYGDYALNFAIFEKFLEKNEKSSKKKFCDENGYAYGTMMHAESNLKHYRYICERIFQNVSSKIWKRSTSRTQKQSEELFKKMNQCLLSGFVDKTSSLINKTVGYFCHKGSFITKIHSSSIYSFPSITEEELPQLICSAEVSKDEKFKSKWVFPIELEWVKMINKKVHKKVKRNIDKQLIPSHVITRHVPSRILRYISSKSWLFPHFMKGKADLHFVNNREFYFQVVTNEKNFEKIQKIVDEYLDYLKASFEDGVVEVKVANIGRVLLGNGLKIKGILPLGQFKTFYIRTFPRILLDIKKNYWNNLNSFAREVLQLGKNNFIKEEGKRHPQFNPRLDIRGGH